MHVALVSLDQVWEDKDANQKSCSFMSNHIIEISEKVDLIIYPEMTLTGFSITNKEISESIEGSETVDFFKKLSKETKCSHVFGYSARNFKGQYFNRCCFIDCEGELLDSYDKIHTFSYAGENELYTNGLKPTVLKTIFADIGLSICFDLRFSALYGYYRRHCNLMINIANWPSSRKMHWHTLLKARAIENQFYMVGVNRTGIDGLQQKYTPSSVVYDPIGNLVEPVLCNEECSIYCLDINEVKSIRNSFPIENDMNYDLYEKLLKK